MAKKADKTVPSISGKVFKPYPLERVVILGMGMSTYDWNCMQYMSPMWGDMVEVWGINQAALTFHCHKMISAHEHSVLDTDGYAGGNVIELAHKMGLGDRMDFISLDTRPEYPRNYEYPLWEVVNRFGENYLMNSIPYSIALALLMDVKEIYFFGCDFDYAGVKSLEQLHMREAGRPCTEFWMGFAKAKGVKTFCGMRTTLLDTTARRESGGLLYGYNDHRPEFGIVRDRVQLTGFGEPKLDFKRVEASVDSVSDPQPDQRDPE